MMMLRLMLRYLLSGIPAPPPLGGYLWSTLGVLVLSILSLLFKAELWPTTPALPRLLELATGLAALAAVPQALWWGWQWLQAYSGPSWLRRLASVGYVGGAMLCSLLWLLGLVNWLMKVGDRYF